MKGRATVADRLRQLSAPTAVILALIGLAACAGTAPPTPLGPVDGRDLPPNDLERVRVGMPAPDFTLEGLGGGRVTLSTFEGQRHVVLVFYRGHW